MRIRNLFVVAVGAGVAFVHQRALRTERQIAAYRVAGGVEALPARYPCRTLAELSDAVAPAMAAARTWGFGFEVRPVGEGCLLVVTGRLP